ncbi:MAG TPA: GNAT family N-acetyltransferase [Patescibacteria group bacterium]|nr:GNAT family N-acetyltransferase [Patescibacteria group bacterium]
MAERAVLTLDYQISEHGLGVSNDVREQIAEVSAAAQMIVLTNEVIDSHQRNVVATSDGHLVGYAALAEDYKLSDADGQEHRAVELGGAVVMSDFRRRGIASLLLGRRVQIMQEDPSFSDDTRAVVFTNTSSRPYIERAGFRPLKKSESLDTRAFELCSGCTSCPLAGPKPWEDPKTCCDYEGIRVAVPSELPLY